MLSANHENEMSLNYIPIIGWALALFFSSSLAVPFWFIWTHCGIGEKYFYWLPSVYRSISFWNCVGLFIVIGILKLVLVPTIVDVTQKNESK